MDIQEESIDLMKLLHALWKNILVIVLVAIIGGFAAFGYTAFMVSPTYNATVSLYVNKSTVNIGATNFAISNVDTTASSSVVNIYLYILKSRTTMEEVIKEADLSYSPGALSGMISAKSISGTGAFEVTVTSRNPAETELIANTIAKILPDRISEIVDGTVVRVVDYAIIPTSRSGPNIMRNTEIGMLAGAVLSAGIIVLLSLLNDNANAVIQSADDLRALYPDMVILSTIPDMRVSDKKNGYYSKYYGEPKKGGKKHA